MAPPRGQRGAHRRWRSAARDHRARGRPADQLVLKRACTQPECRKAARGTIPGGFLFRASPAAGRATAAESSGMKIVRAREDEARAPRVHCREFGEPGAQRDQDRGRVRRRQPLPRR
jgi:hypothetical protein